MTLPVEVNEVILDDGDAPPAVELPVELFDVGFVESEETRTPTPQGIESPLGCCEYSGATLALAEEAI